jgi:hypothetical protein
MMDLDIKFKLIKQIANENKNINTTSIINMYLMMFNSFYFNVKIGCKSNNINIFIFFI